MKACFIILTSLFSFFVSNVFSIHFNDSGGSETSLNAYKGKKILIVNIATSSGHASQLAGLQQLYQQYSNKLVVVAFPSNSFGNEEKTDAAITAFCHDTYHTTFPIAQKAQVTGTDVQPLYNWLTLESENGAMNNTVLGDYQKFLLDEDGELLGVFAPAVNPMDSTIQHAISN